MLTRCVIAGLILVAVATGAAPSVQAASTTGDQETSPGSTQKLLQQVVEHRLATTESVADLLRSLRFVRVFGSLSTAELLQVLDRHALLASPTDAATLLSDLTPFGLSLDRLRPDGVLCAMGMLAGKPVLKGQPVEVKRKLEEAFERDRAAFLDALPPERVLELFDDRIKPEPAGNRQRFYAYASQPITSAGIDNMIYGYALRLEKPGDPTIRESTPQDAVAATAQMRPGQAYIRCGTFQLLEPRQDPDGMIDRVAGAGKNDGAALPWMDQWEKGVGARFEDFFRRYHALGGKLDIFTLDFEDKGLGLPGWFASDRQVAAVEATRALLADPRWPGLKGQLEIAGIKNFDRIDQWYNQRDYRAVIWNAVTECQRAGYLRRAIYEPVRRYYPHVKFVNYGNFLHCQTYPFGDLFRFTESYHSVGAVVGTHQGIPLYSNPRRTPSEVDKPQTWNATRPAIRSLSGMAEGLIISVSDSLQGAQVGDDVRIVFSRGGQKLKDELSSGSILVTSFNGSRKVLQRIDDKTIRVEHGSRQPFRVTFEAPRSNPPRLLAFNSYQAFISDVLLLRTMTAASDIPLAPWLPHRDTLREIREWRNGHPYWSETVLHAALSGADFFPYWVSSKMTGTHHGNGTLSQLLKELDTYVGFERRRPLPPEPIGADRRYALTGMEVGGRRVWRLTPRTDQTIRVISSEPASFEFGPEQLTIPGSRLLRHDQTSARLGYWIIQENGVSMLRYPAPEVLRRLAEATGQASVPRPPSTATVAAAE